MAKEFTLGPAILFCPADRPERYLKALERSDAIIIDLEDAVAPQDRPAAREAIIEAFGSEGIIGSNEEYARRVIIRVNPVDSADFLEDAQAVRTAGVDLVMVPKVEKSAQLDAFSEALPDVGVVALCETAAGIIQSPEISAHESVVAVMWGAEDLMASMGGTTSRHENGNYREVAKFARSQVLLAASAFGKAVIDSIHTDLHNAEAVLEEAQDAVASGFQSKACIHPAQVAPIREAFIPSQEQVTQAEEMLEAVRVHGAAFQFRGKMIDEPLIKQAQRVLQRAGKA